MSHILSILERNPDLANAVATFAATAVALIALMTSVATLYIQRRHNVLSLKPLPMISVGDYEDDVSVTIENNGPGPMIVTKLSVSGGSEPQNSLVACVPALPSDMHWKTFIGPIIQSRTIAPNTELVVLQLSGDDSDAAFRAARDRCRQALSKLVLVVHYTDVYKSRVPALRQELTWFGRHWTEAGDSNARVAAE